MNLNYTRIMHFLTIVKYMNMNKAASELYISQPALSLSISHLEEELGVPLFYRNKKKLILSREAQLLLPRFQQLQADYDGLFLDIQLLRNPDQNRFINISFSGSKYFFLPLQMTGILDQFQQINTKLCYLDIAMATEMLLAGQTDLAISSPLIRHSRITTTELLTEPIGLVLPASHPMASRPSISLKDLEQIPIHGQIKETSFRHSLDAICSTHDIQIHYATESNTPTYNEYLRNNDGTCGFFSTLENYHQTFQKLGEYIYHPIDDKIFNRKIGISYLTDSEIPYKYAEFIEALKDNIHKINELHHHMSFNLMQSMTAL